MLNSPPIALQISSVEDLDKRMAELASAGKIDPAFLQISAKAYGAARDTNMTKDEAKWVAYKMYRTVRPDVVTRAGIAGDVCT